MKIKKSTILAIGFLLVALAINVSFAFGQRSVFPAPCPATTARADIKTDKFGNINIVPCPTRNVFVNGSPLSAGGGGVTNFNGRTGAITFGLSDVPNLPASQITSGIFATAQIPTLAASKISGGVFDLSLIPDFDAAKIATGTIGTARLGTGTASATTFLRGDGTWATPTAGGSTFNGTLSDAANNFVDLIFSPSAAVSSRFRYEGRSASLLYAGNSREFQFLDNNSNATLAVGNARISALVPLVWRRAVAYTGASTTTISTADTNNLYVSAGGVIAVPSGMPTGSTITLVAYNGNPTSANLSLPTGSIIQSSAGLGYKTFASNTLLQVQTGAVTLSKIDIDNSNHWVIVANTGNLSYIN